MNKIKAIIFDLDGTLIDSVTDLTNSVNYTLAEIGMPGHTTEEIRSYVGDGVQKLIKRSLGQTHLDKFDDAFSIFMKHYGAHCTDNTVLCNGVSETIPELAQNYLLAVLTNKSLQFSLKIMHALKITPYFKEVLGGDSLPTKKPDPEGLLLLAEKWTIDPVGEMIMVGDHATDIEVGKRAGCRTVFIKGGIGETRALVPDLIISSIAELPDLLKNL
ncbi:HAD-IA family hydrolase [Thermodesulfobacteriota bacterium]